MIQIGIIVFIFVPKYIDEEFLSWVFRRFFVADGNFKADHIRQKNDFDDVWLSEGGGMMPRRDNYEEFLKTAKERRTACHLLSYIFDFP